MENAERDLIEMKIISFDEKDFIVTSGGVRDDETEKVQ